MTPETLVGILDRTDVDTLTAGRVDSTVNTRMLLGATLRDGSTILIGEVVVTRVEHGTDGARIVLQIPPGVDQGSIDEAVRFDITGTPPGGMFVNFQLQPATGPCSECGVFFDLRVLGQHEAQHPGDSP